MISTNRLIGPLSLLHDRGSPTLIRLVGPCRIAHIKGRWGQGSHNEVQRSRNPTYRQTLNRSKRGAASDGLHRAGAASTLASKLLRRHGQSGESSQRVRRLTPDLRLHREVHICDPNIGIGARLPLCDSNPNRVKEMEKGPGVAEVTGTPVTTATAREKCRTDTARKNRSVFGSEKK